MGGGAREEEGAAAARAAGPREERPAASRSRHPPCGAGKGRCGGTGEEVGAAAESGHPGEEVGMPVETCLRPEWSGTPRALLCGEPLQGRARRPKPRSRVLAGQEPVPNRPLFPAPRR
jgi:hypothetical protein